MAYLRALVLLAVVLVACDSGSEGGGPSLDDLPEVLVDALCPEIEGCLGEQGSEVVFGEGGCADRLRAQLEDGDFDATKEAVESGRVKYDGSKLEACLDPLEGIGCGFQTMRALTNQACDGVLEGSVEIGGACAIDEDCEDVAFCERIANACPGTCTVLLGAGELCADDDQCDDGLACLQGQCAAPAKLDQPCEGGVASQCAAGLSCVGNDNAEGRAGTCRDPETLFTLKLGAVCNFDTGALCEEGLSCVVMSVPAAGQQAELRCSERFESGEACRFGAPSPCPDGEHCAGVNLALGIIDGTCEPLPEAGESCGGAFGQPCADGLHCDIDGRCHPFSRLGQPCVSNAGCASGQCDAGRCVRPTGCALATDAGSE